MENCHDIGNIRDLYTSTGNTSTPMSIAIEPEHSPGIRSLLPIARLHEGPNGDGVVHSPRIVVPASRSNLPGPG
jgi:hypothetical protein